LTLGTWSFDFPPCLGIALARGFSFDKMKAVAEHVHAKEEVIKELPLVESAKGVSTNGNGIHIYGVDFPVKIW